MVVVAAGNYQESKKKNSVNKQAVGIPVHFNTEVYKRLSGD